MHADLGSSFLFACTCFGSEFTSPIEIVTSVRSQFESLTIGSFQNQHNSKEIFTWCYCKTFLSYISAGMLFETQMFWRFSLVFERLIGLNTFHSVFVHNIFLGSFFQTLSSFLCNNSSGTLFHMQVALTHYTVFSFTMKMTLS